MPLEPDAQAVMDEYAKQKAPPLSSLDIETLRASARATVQIPGPDVGRVENRAVPGPRGDIPVRVYRDGENPGGGLIVYLHGGGFAMGGLDMYDPICRHLAAGSGCTLVSVDYRLAPENPYPAPGEDAYAATCWVAEHAEDLGGRADRLVVMGDSAGGSLALVVCLMARDKNGPAITQQISVYGTTEMVVSNPELDGVGLLGSADCEWFWDLYVPDRTRRGEPYCSPLRAESLAGLPPAFVLTAEYDPTRDATERYAHRLAAEGVLTTLKRYPGSFHGFFSMTFLNQGRRSLDDVLLVLRSVAGSSHRLRPSQLPQ
jgi:acetyl esterase